MKKNFVSWELGKASKLVMDGEYNFKNKKRY